MFRDAWRHAPTHHKVWALAAPMILSNLSVPLVALVDTAVVGHLPHAHQLGAVAVGSSLLAALVVVWVWRLLWRGVHRLVAPLRAASTSAVRRSPLS